LPPWYYILILLFVSKYI